MQIKKALVYLLVLISLLALSYYFIDRQLVWFLAKHHSRDFGVLKSLANDIPAAIGAFVFFFYIYFAIKLTNNALNTFDKKIIVMCNTIVAAEFIKDVLKGIFGRYATGTFICNNQSLINNDAYGFEWFAKGTAFSSFPSGHTTLIFSFAVSMSLLFPKQRWLWCMLPILVVIGQLGMYYHFVSDILAGAALGSIVAICNYRYSVQLRS